MNNDLNEAKKTIRDLLNRADDDASSELEIEAALKFSRRLMLRHNLEEADCKEATSPHEIAADTEYGTTDAFPVATRLTGFESQVGRAICNLVGTVAFFRSSGSFIAKSPQGTVQFDKKGQSRETMTKLVFYGPASDARDAADLFTEWTTTIVAMGRLRHGGYVRGSGRDYVEGFAHALAEKVVKIQDEEEKMIESGEATADYPMNELVLVGKARDIMVAKLDRCSDYLLNEKGIKLTASSGRSTKKSFDGGAYSQGKADGARANFTRKSTKAIA